MSLVLVISPTWGTGERMDHPSRLKIHSPHSTTVAMGQEVQTKIASSIAGLEQEMQSHHFLKLQVQLLTVSTLVR